MVVAKHKRSSNKPKTVSKKQGSSSNIDMHKVWLIGGISIAVLVVAILIIFPVLKGPVAGQAVLTAPGGLRLFQEDGTNIYSNSFTYEGNDYEIKMVKNIRGKVIGLAVDKSVVDLGLGSQGAGAQEAGQMGAGLGAGAQGAGPQGAGPLPTDLGYAIGPETDCNDGKDNNNDARIDCDDEDCWGYGACSNLGMFSGLETCSKNVNCDSVNCVPMHPLFNVGHPVCTNKCGGVENDCPEGWSCEVSAGSDANFICIPPFTNEDCSDGTSNDNDGLIDCVDPDCSGDPNCIDGTAKNSLQVCTTSCVDSGEVCVDKTTITDDNANSPYSCESCEEYFGDNVCTCPAYTAGCTVNNEIETTIDYYGTDETCDPDINDADGDGDTTEEICVDLTLGGGNIKVWDLTCCNYECSEYEESCSEPGNNLQYFGLPCETDADCGEKCVWKDLENHNEGSVCTITCLEECPNDWTCQADYGYSTGGGLKYYCRPGVSQ